MPGLFEHILFPIDFSDRCRQAAPLVAAMARQFGSHVTLLHAIGDDTNAFTRDAPSSFEWREWLIRDAEPLMESFGAAVLDGVVVDRQIEAGEPGELIRQYASDHAVDLITIPTHGRGVFRRFLLGSVTSKVLHDCVCPVWTTAHCGALGLSAPDIRRVLCALDLTESCKRVFEDARNVASAWGAELRIIHAVPVPGDLQEAMMNQEFATFLADTATKQIADLQRRSGTSYEALVVTGDVADVIRQSALDWRANLVVMGRGHSRAHFGALRTHAISIIRESPCPVLSF